MLYPLRKNELGAMLLSEKLKLLRSLEGNLRGLNRALTKSEVVRMIQEEFGEYISQAYLSQLEAGKREHMTAKSRELLARFFKVHPGYLVNDPEGFRTELTSFAGREDQLDTWLHAGAASIMGNDPELADALRVLAGLEGTREIFLLMAHVARHPEIIQMLQEAFGDDSEPRHDQNRKD